ncbi:hypothetical protein GGF31_002067 [Allomyces arbusculus]|nr:hypothetical protein GGF31_002067 [Allomyces arbusculus]
MAPAAAAPPRAPSFSSRIGPLAAQLEAAYGTPHALLPATTTPATAAAPAARAPTSSSLSSTLAPLAAHLEAVRGPPGALLPPPTGAAYGASPVLPPPTAAGYASYPGSAPTTAWAATAPAYPAGWSATAPLPPPPPAPARLAVTHAALVQDLTSRANPCIATSSTDHVWTVSLTDESAASGKRAKPGVASNGAGAAGEAHSGTCDLRLWLLLDAPAQEAAFVEFDVAATLTNVMDVNRVPLVDRGYVLCRATHLVSVHLRFKVALRRLDTYRLDVTLNVKGNGGEARPVVVRGLPSQITLVSRRTADRRKASFQTPDHAAATSSTDPPATCTPPPPPPPPPAAKRARFAVAPDATPPLQPTTSDSVPPPVMTLDTGSASLARALVLMSQPNSPTAEEVARVVGAVGSANRVARMAVLERWITRQVQEYSDGQRGGWSEPAMRAVVAAVGSDVWDPELWLSRPLALHGTQFPLHAVVSPARLLPLARTSSSSSSSPRPRPLPAPIDAKPLFATILAAIDVDTLCAALAARNASGSTPAVLAARHANPAVPAAFFSVLATHVAIGPVLSSKDATGECAASVLARRGADGVHVVHAVVEAVRGVRGGVKAVLHGMREYVEGRAEVWGEVCVRMMDAVAREEGGAMEMEMEMRDEIVTSV